MKTFNLPAFNKPATNDTLSQWQSRIGKGVGFTDIAIAPQTRDVGNLSSD